MVSSPPRILIVEDEPTIRLAITSWLQDEGFEVLEASNVDEALAIFEGGDDVDALFTDVRMPGRLDGMDLACLARKSDPALPILLTSGYAAMIRQRLSQIAPPAEFIRKPYSIAAVARMLKDMMGLIP